MNITPNIEKVKSLAAEYKTVPLSAKIKCGISPLEVLQKLKAISSHCYMLESCEDRENGAASHFWGLIQRRKSPARTALCKSRILSACALQFKSAQICAANAGRA